MPARKTVTTFKVDEAAIGSASFLEKLTFVYGVNCDGSKRGDRDVFEIIVFGWDAENHQPCWMVVNIVDLGRTTKAADMAAALVWTIVDHCKLDPEKWLCSVSDNTNSMSGTRDTSATSGGVFQHVRRHFGFRYAMPRSACTRHVVHLSWPEGRIGLMGGPVPGPQQHRDSGHVWSLLWFLWLEFGADNTDWLAMKAAVEAKGLHLVTTWKPIHTR